MDLNKHLNLSLEKFCKNNKIYFYDQKYDLQKKFFFNSPVICF